jgi:hypothetical protein
MGSFLWWSGAIAWGALGLAVVGFIALLLLHAIQAAILVWRIRAHIKRWHGPFPLWWDFATSSFDRVHINGSTYEWPTFPFKERPTHD